MASSAQIELPHSNIDTVSDLPQISSSLLETAAFSAGIESRPQQNVTFTFTSPSVADNVPDTSIFTTLPSASFDALLEQYEDPITEVPITIQLSPQKENLTIMPLPEVSGATQNSTNTLPDLSHCSCPADNKGEEVPVEQVFIRDGQMYRLPEACVVFVGNMELYGFYKNDQWYVSLVMLFHLIGPEAKQLYEKAILHASNLDIMTMGDNDLDLIIQRSGLDRAETSRDLISVTCLQALSRHICELVDLPVAKNIACSDIYRKVLGNNVKCSNCGLIIEKEPTNERYELIWKQTDDATTDNNIPVTAGFVSASNAKFCAFQMNESIYINLAEIVRFKLFNLTAIQKKLCNLDISPIAAPSDVELYFESDSALLSKGMWIDLVTLRCVCCMGSGKCAVKGHSYDVWQALKLGKCTYEPNVSLLVEDTSQHKTDISLPLLYSEKKKFFPKTNVKVATRSLAASQDKMNTNGSDDIVSSTTGDILPPIPNCNKEKIILHVPETIIDKNEVPVKAIDRNELMVVHENETHLEVNEMANNDSDNGIFECKVAEPSGEIVEVKIADLDENTDERCLKDKSENSLDQCIVQNKENGHKTIEGEDLDKFVEVTVFSAGSLQEPVYLNDRSSISDVISPGDLKTDYFVGRPRGRPTKLHETFVFKSSVEKSTKKGIQYMYSGDYIVPDVEELNKQIRCKQVIVGEKSYSCQTSSVLIGDSSFSDSTNISTKDKTMVSGATHEDKENCAATSVKGSKSPVIRYQKKHHKSLDTEKDVKEMLNNKKITPHDGAAAEVDSNGSMPAEIFDHYTKAGEKVITEFVSYNVSEQAITAHENNIEKAEFHQSSEFDEAHKNESVFPKTVKISNKGDSNKVNSTDTSVLNSVTETDHSADSYLSTDHDIYSQTDGVLKSPLKSPPSKRVERLCSKLSSSENLNRPDISLLTLATLAAENESESEAEIDQMKPVDKIIDQKNTSKEKGIRNNSVSEFSFEDLSSEQQEILQKENSSKMEDILLKIKKYILLGFDKEYGLFKVEGFDKRARAVLPALFAPGCEALLAKFAAEVSKYVSYKYRQFMLQNEKRRVVENYGGKEKACSKSIAAKLNLLKDTQVNSNLEANSEIAVANEVAKVAENNDKLSNVSGKDDEKANEIESEELIAGFQSKILSTVAQKCENKGEREKINPNTNIPDDDSITSSDNTLYTIVQKSRQSTFTDNVNSGNVPESQTKSSKKICLKLKRSVDKTSRARECNESDGNSENIGAGESAREKNEKKTVSALDHEGLETTSIPADSLVKQDMQATSTPSGEGMESLPVEKLHVSPVVSLKKIKMQGKNVDLSGGLKCKLSIDAGKSADNQKQKRSLEASTKRKGEVSDNDNQLKVVDEDSSNVQASDTDIRTAESQGTSRSPSGKSPIMKKMTVKESSDTSSGKLNKTSQKVLSNEFEVLNNKGNISKTNKRKPADMAMNNDEVTFKESGDISNKNNKQNAVDEDSSSQHDSDTFIRISEVLSSPVRIKFSRKKSPSTKEKKFKADSNKSSPVTSNSPTQKGPLKKIQIESKKSGPVTSKPSSQKSPSRKEKKRKADSDISCGKVNKTSQNVQNNVSEAVSNDEDSVIKTNKKKLAEMASSNETVTKENGDVCDKDNKQKALAKESRDHQVYNTNNRKSEEVSSSPVATKVSNKLSPSKKSKVDINTASSVINKSPSRKKPSSPKKEKKRMAEGDIPSRQHNKTSQSDLSECATDRNEKGSVSKTKKRKLVEMASNDDDVVEDNKMRRMRKNNKAPDKGSI